MTREERHQEIKMAALEYALRPNLTPAQREVAAHIGRIEFASTGAKRKSK